jgi:hypothetical protein
MSEIKPIITIGRLEKVSFPALGIIDIDAKIDTGAYTTALHCHDVELRRAAGKDILVFKLLDPNHPEYNQQLIIFEQFSIKAIKNSFGDFEKRYVIKTQIKIGRKIVKTSISLTDRGNMRFPVLIGRKLLKKRFVVDVTATYLLNKKK